MKCKCNNLPQLVEEREIVSRPYKNALELSTNPNLVSPLIKYGVNPISGVPLTDDFLFNVVDSVSKHGPNATTNDSMVVGERRAMLIRLFCARASYLFENALKALNVQYDTEFKYRFKDIHSAFKKSSRWRYDDFGTNEIFFLFNNNMFTNEGYEYFYNNSGYHEEVGRNRNRMSRLVDLEYYNNMPLETVLENIISAAAINYKNHISVLDGVILESNSLVSLQYNDYIQFIGMCHANMISSAESVVMVLYEEAKQLLDAGYPGQFGITFDEEFKAQQTAFINRYAAIQSKAAEDHYRAE